MATGKKITYDGGLPITHWVHTDKGWVEGSTIISKGYVRMESYNFPSPRKRPLVLSCTVATLSRYFNNRSMVKAYSPTGNYDLGPAHAVLKTAYSESSLSTTGDASSASVRAKNNLNKPDLNVSVFLGEGRESAKLFADTAVRLAKAYNAFRAGNRKEAYRILSSQVSRRQDASIRETLNASGASSAWLQYSFGWKPLLSDLYTAITRDWERMEKGKVLSGFGASGPSQKNLDPFDLARVPRATAGWKGTVKVPEAAWMQSLGLLNPLQLAWELYPMSFISDWFFNINALLGGLTSTAGLSDLTAWYITESVLHTVAVDGTVTHTMISATRKPGSPPLDVASRFGLGGWHLTTSLALIRKTFSSR